MAKGKKIHGCENTIWAASSRIGTSLSYIETGFILSLISFEWWFWKIAVLRKKKNKGSEIVRFLHIYLGKSLISWKRKKIKHFIGKKHNLISFRVVLGL